MSETTKPTLMASPLPSLDLKDLTTVLLKHFGIHQGFYETSINFMIATGGVGELTNLKPGAIVAVSGVGLAPVAAEHPNAVDASEANPA